MQFFSKARALSAQPITSVKARVPSEQESRTGGPLMAGPAFAPGTMGVQDVRRIRLAPERGRVTLVASVVTSARIARR